MGRLTVTLEAEHLEAIDRLMGGSFDHVPDRCGRREAIPALLIACDRNRLEAARLERWLRRLQDRVASVERARDEAAAQVVVVQSRLEAALQALREERRRHGVTRGLLNNALRTAAQLRTAGTAIANSCAPSTGRWAIRPASASAARSSPACAGA